MLFKKLTSSAAAMLSLLCLLGCEPSKNSHTDSSIARPVDKSLCMLQQGSCLRSIDNLDVSFQLSDPTAPSETPMTLTLTTNVNVDDLKVHLAGRDMFMGKIPVLLTQEGEDPGQSIYTYQGQVIYGACSSGYMVWNAVVSFRYQARDYQVIFPFVADQ